MAGEGTNPTGWGLTMIALPGGENTDLGIGEMAQWAAALLEGSG